MTGVMKKPRIRNGITGLFKWWAWQGLNLRPLRCQHYRFIGKRQKTAISFASLVRTQSEHLPIRAYPWCSRGTVAPTMLGGA